MLNKSRKQIMTRPMAAMSWIRTTFFALIAVALGSAGALAGKDEESVASWLPGTKPFNDARASLAKNGVDFGVIFVTDSIANVTRGTKRGGVETGRFDPYLDLNL
jgi:carbohydrate-selective porin OprB